MHWVWQKGDTQGVWSPDSDSASVTAHDASQLSMLESTVHITLCGLTNSQILFAALLLSCI